MVRSFNVALALATVLSGCAGRFASAPSAVTNAPGITPQVVQNGTETGGQWKSFSPKTASGVYRGMVLGPDKNVYFADDNADKLARISMVGGIKELSTPSFAPDFQAVGTDNKFYIICVGCTTGTGGGLIGVLTTTGGFVTHNTPSGDVPGSNELGLGPVGDGKVWFAEKAHIANITTSGIISEFAYPSGENQNTASHPVAGPDGNVWFTEYFKSQVGNINPSTHALKEFDVSATCNSPHGMAVGPDNNLYFMCNSAGLAQMTTSGSLTAFSLAGHGTSVTGEEVIRGPDNHIWFVSGQSNELGDFNTATHVITYHTAPIKTGLIDFIMAGPDGNVWGTEGSSHVDVFILVKLRVKPTSLSFGGVGQVQGLTATYSGAGALTATSANTAVATVAPGATKNTFNVTSQGSGTTTITVMDAMGNLFNIKVTVS